MPDPVVENVANYCDKIPSFPCILVFILKYVGTILGTY